MIDRNGPHEEPLRQNEDTVVSVRGVDARSVPRSRWGKVRLVRGWRSFSWKLFTR